MATATNELVREFRVEWDKLKRVVTVTSLPSGAKSLTVDTGLVRGKGVSLPELDVIDKLRGVDKVSLNLGEMKLLAGLRDRCNSKVTSNGVAGEVAKKTLAMSEAGVQAKARGYGTTQDEATVNRLENAVEILRGELWALTYDIESSKKKKCPNPSKFLWHYGFRFNKSCWILPTKNLHAPQVQELLAHWQRHEIECFTIRQHPDETKKMVGIARTRLEKEILRIQTSLLTRLESASKRLEEAREDCEDKDDEKKAEKKADSDAREILNSAIKAFRAALDCARMFDDTSATKHLFEGLRQAIEAERLAFNARMKKVGGKGVWMQPAAI